MGFPLVQLPKKFKVATFLSEYSAESYMFPLVQLPKKFKGAANS